LIAKARKQKSPAGGNRWRGHWRVGVSHSAAGAAMRAVG
jgi:hypothetical protein